MQIYPIITDHGVLTGLGDDDHAQYVLNDAEGTDITNGTFDLTTTGFLKGGSLVTGGNIGIAADLDLLVLTSTNLVVRGDATVWDDLTIGRGTLADPTILFNGSVGGDGKIIYNQILDLFNLEDAGIDTDGKITAGTVSAEQVTSTDDITMEGHLLSLGDDTTDTDIILRFLGSTNDANLTYEPDVDRFNYDDTAILTTGTGRFDGGIGVNTDQSAYYPVNVARTDTTGNGVAIRIHNDGTGINAFGVFEMTVGAGIEGGKFFGSQTNNYEDDFGIVDGVTFRPGTTQQDMALSAGGSVGGTRGPTLKIVGSTNVTEIGDPSNSNNNQFASDGTQTMVGTATVWNDLQFQVSSAKVPASNFPSWEAFTTNTFEYAFDVDEFAYLMANELHHSWKQGTAANVHLHLTNKTAQSTGANRFAKFTVYIAYADVDEVWQETSLTAELTIPTGTSALTNFYLDMGDLTLTNYLIGAQVKCTVLRIDATGGTEYADSVFITQVGMHLEEDTIGSNTELVK